MTLISNVQKYCIHDGKGIRTTVFFKGCPLKCAWCHNPETQSKKVEIRYFRERCIGCGACERVCRRNAVSAVNGKMILNREKCSGCGECAEVCMQNAIEPVGEEPDLKQLIKRLEADQIFYEESGGGVTLSGGEVMSADFDRLEELVKALNDKGISVNIDTCGFCDFERIEKLTPYIDTFLYDLKLLDREEHIRYTGVDNTLILTNLKKLSRLKAKIWIRLPLIKSVNADIAYIDAVGDYLREMEIFPEQINLIPYHRYGFEKNEQLGRKAQNAQFDTPSDEELEAYRRILSSKGFERIIIGG